MLDWDLHCHTECAISYFSNTVIFYNKQRVQVKVNRYFLVIEYECIYLSHHRLCEFPPEDVTVLSHVDSDFQSFASNKTSWSTKIKRNEEVYLCYMHVGTWLAVMLTSIQSAGVTPEVNLRNSAQARKHASEKSTLLLKPRADVTRSPKQGYPWPHGKDSCPPKIFKNKRKKKVLSCVLTECQCWR